MPIIMIIIKKIKKIIITILYSINEVIDMVTIDMF